MRRLGPLSAAVLISMSFGVGIAGADQKAAQDTGEKVTLMLGGKFCESYPDDVREAVKKVPGVKSVDLKSMPGHAVVHVEPGKTKPDQLVKAINGVKGSGWHCTAQIMK
jgi:mercuric ion binding protein